MESWKGLGWVLKLIPAMEWNPEPSIVPGCSSLALNNFREVSALVTQEAEMKTGRGLGNFEGEIASFSCGISCLKASANHTS